MVPFGERLVGLLKTVFNLFGTKRYQEALRLVKLEQTSWRECPFRHHNYRRRHALSHGLAVCRKLDIVTRSRQSDACRPVGFRLGVWNSTLHRPRPGFLAKNVSRSVGTRPKNASASARVSKPKICALSLVNPIFAAHNPSDPRL